MRLEIIELLDRAGNRELDLILRFIRALLRKEPGARQAQK